MKKPLTEKIEKELETVEDMIRALMQVPKGYTLHPLGQKCEMLVDHYNKCIYLDGPLIMDDLIYETEENAKEIGDALDVNVPDAKLKPFSQELFVVMGYTDSYHNGNEDAALFGVFSSKEKACECGNELVKMDCIKRYEIECPELDEFGYK